MNIKETKALIKDGYNRLYVLTNLSWKDYREEMLKYEKKLAKDWRDSTRDNWRVDVDWHLTTTEEAKFFCIQHILNALKAKEPIAINSILHCKESYCMAHALVSTYREKIEEAFKGFDLNSFDLLNYTEFHSEVA